MNCEKSFKCGKQNYFKKQNQQFKMCAQSYSFVGIRCKETAETAGGDELPQK